MSTTSTPPRQDTTSIVSNIPRPKSNPLHYDEAGFADVEAISKMTHEELENEDKLKIAKFCERLIRSGENSNFILKKFISKADLSYVNDNTGDNLLNISILSGNFRAVDVLLSHKCPRDVRNDRGYSADGFVKMTSCHKTVKTIFEKYPLDVDTSIQDDQVSQTVETTPV